MFQGDLLDQVVAHVTELSPRQIASPIDIDRRRELSDGKFTVLDPVGNLAHDLEDKLDIGDILLDLDNAFAHLGFHAARTNLASNVAD